MPPSMMIIINLPVIVAMAVKMSIIVEVTSKRALDITRTRGVPFDAVRVIAVHQANHRRQIL